MIPSARHSERGTGLCCLGLISLTVRRASLPKIMTSEGDRSLAICNLNERENQGMSFAVED